MVLSPGFGQLNLGNYLEDPSQPKEIFCLTRLDLKSKFIDLRKTQQARNLFLSKIKKNGNPTQGEQGGGGGAFIFFDNC